MTSFFLRLLIAVLVVVVLFALFPAVFHLLGFAVSGDLDVIIRGVISICALLYIIWGPPVPKPWA